MSMISAIGPSRAPSASGPACAAGATPVRAVGAVPTLPGVLHALGAPVARFVRDDDASLSVEAVLVIPLLLWAFLATYTFFDIYRAKNLALKANYAISDLLSRETNTINMNYLLGTEKVFQFLTQSDTASWVRVTVVYCNDHCADSTRTLRADWSRATDGLPTFSDADVMSHLEPIIPWMAEGERVIIVETAVDYEPPFSQNLTGIGERKFVDVVMTRPRFAPQLCWSGVGCGS